MRVSIVVLLTGLVAATYGFGIYLFAQLVPDMQASLHFDIAGVGTLTAAAQLSAMAFSMLAAWLTRRLGGGLTIAGAGLVCAASLALVPWASDVWQLGVLLVLLAGMASTVFVPMVGVVAETVAYRYRGLAMGLASSGTSYGVFLNSLLVPFYAPRGEWRSVWWLESLLTLALAMAFLLAYRRGRRAADPLPEVPAAGEPTVGAPLHLRGLPGRRWVPMVWAMTLLLGFSTFPFQNYLSAYLRSERGLGVDDAAHIWAVIGCVGMFSGLLLGGLSDRIGLRVTMLLAYACIVLAAAILVVSPYGGWLLASGVLFSLAFYPIFGLIPAYVSKQAASPAVAVAVFGVANVVQGVGGMLGNYGAGLLASHSGTFCGVYQAIALVNAGLMLLAAGLPAERRGAAIEAIPVPHA